MAASTLCSGRLSTWVAGRARWKICSAVANPDGRGGHLALLRRAARRDGARRTHAGLRAHRPRDRTGDRRAALVAPAGRFLRRDEPDGRARTGRGRRGGKAARRFRLSGAATARRGRARVPARPGPRRTRPDFVPGQQRAKKKRPSCSSGCCAMRTGTSPPASRTSRNSRGRVRALAATAPERLQVVGDLRGLPHLLRTHHLVISRAETSIVQEAIAARCPLIAAKIGGRIEEANMLLLAAGQRRRARLETARRRPTGSSGRCVMKPACSHSGGAIWNRSAARAARWPSRVLFWSTIPFRPSNRRRDCARCPRPTENVPCAHTSRDPLAPPAEEAAPLRPAHPQRHGPMAS